MAINDLASTPTIGLAVKSHKKRKTESI